MINSPFLIIMYNYILKRSKRKTISVTVNKDCEIVVKCPYFVTKHTVESFLREKKQWIDGRLKECRENKKKRENFWDEYNSFILMGKQFTAVKDNCKTTYFDGKILHIEKNSQNDKIKDDIIRIYKKISKEIILNTADSISKHTHLIPARIKINKASKRWGSCSGKNSLNFSCFLIMADIRAVEYVVLHELCHIKHHDHSKRFWGLVKSYMPDYKQRQKMLVELQKKLEGEDW